MTMTVKLHRCPMTFAKSSRHPCWRVQTALDEAGIDYELVRQPLRRSKRTDLERRTGQRLVPAIEFEDGSILREESALLAARIRDGRLGLVPAPERHAQTPAARLRYAVVRRR
jgi:glutathione S-transferase